jgi:hypothetical protein
MLSAAERFALLAVGRSVDSPSKREKPKVRKLPKNAPRTHRQVHAVLGAVESKETLSSEDLTNLKL